MPQKSVGTFANRPASPLAGDEYSATDNKHKSTCFVAGTWVAAGDLGSASTPSQITSNQNDYAFAGGTSALNWQRISSDAARNITGLSGGSDGMVKVLSNVGAFTITIQNQNAGSSAINRIITGTGADMSLAADQTILLIYDNTTQRWRVLKNA